VRIGRALLSVSDKTGLVELARALAALGVELVSTGGTARALADAGLDVRDVADVTGFPEMMGGRVKTLHPRVHGGILGVTHDPDHADAMEQHGIEPIDLVCVNLYPFERAAADPGATDDELIEQIDIGGPAMIRSAAKNHERVAVLTDPAQYGAFIDGLRAHDGCTTREQRRELAVEAFARTARYDAAIALRLGTEDALPERMVVALERHDTLRYGENPHQIGAVYARAGAPDGPALTRADVLHGKALSYNNYNDASAAVALAWELHRLDPARTSAAVVKHTNPCGGATARDNVEAIDGALLGDPLAAYGGILACTTTIDAGAATRLCAQGVFLEVIAAPTFDDDALEILRAHSKNVRLLTLGDFPADAPSGVTLRSIVGGDVLAQEADAPAIDASAWAHPAGPEPGDDIRAHAGVVWAMAKHLSSNAIAIGGAPAGARSDLVRLFGAGAGQMDRVASCRLAIEKAGERARGAIAASDAFFPFPDGPELLIDAGVTTIVHPGGSKRDDETFALCERRGVTCLTTGVRHFRH
jgi:phosphoribosylaminoimidazolecarboxamide formyltransferase / IMP cyclohydrolase